MDRPIFLIGAARSGTKIFAELLARHPDIAFWDEPKYVWRHGNHGAREDVREPGEATPEVREFIRQKFEAFMASSGRKRFLEKTPSNCFRVEFVHRVFPDGLFLHLQRDGRAVAASALRRWCSRPDDNAIFRRIRGFEVPLSALHHYLPDMTYELLLRRLRPGRGYLWGPRYPGIHEDIHKQLPIAEICARQWVESEKAVTGALRDIPAKQHFTFSYEELIRDPNKVLERIQSFAGLRHSDDVIDAAHHMLKPDKSGGFPGLPPQQRQLIEAVCLPAMQAIGIKRAEAI